MNIRDITAELDAYRVGGPPIWPQVLASVRALLDTETMWMHRPVPTPTGWHLAHRYADGRAEDHQRFADVLADLDTDYAWFRPSCPEPAQRNRVIEALGAVRRKRPGYYEASPLYERFMVPSRLHEHRQLRVLLCDGDKLLAWFGGYQREPIRRAQRDILTALVPSLRRRLRVELALETAHTLEAVLDRSPVAAYLVSRTGAVQYANAAGRAANHRTPLGPAFELVAIDGGYLAFHRDAPRAPWKLTTRQRDVLARVLAGESTVVIAAALGISARAVEHHLTQLFARAGVTNRAGLVAAALSR